MPQFDYQAFDGDGAKVQGQITAADVAMATQELKSQGLTPVQLKPQATRSSRSIQGTKLSLKDLELMTSELALLLESGVRIDRGLQILSKGAGQSAAGLVMGELAQAVKKGEPLSEAMAKFEGFDQMYLSLVRMGEASGQLAEVFSELAKELKFRNGLRAKVVQSLTYPSIIFTVCVASILFVFNFIVPRMSGLFAQAKELPVYTEMLLGASQWMQDYQLYLFLAVAATVGFMVHLAQQGRLQQGLSEFFYRTPGLRNSVLLVNRIQVSSAMAMLLNSGVRLDQALKMAADGVQLAGLQQALMSARTKVKGGRGLTESLAATGLFPELSLSLLEVGEESGQLGKVFDEVAQRSRNDFDSWTGKITALLEPLMILVMGGVVGGVVVIMLLSITSLNDVAF